VTRPRIALLGRVPRTSVYRNIEQYPEATKIPGILILRVDSAIYFSNSNYVKDRFVESKALFCSLFTWIVNDKNNKFPIQYVKGM